MLLNTIGPNIFFLDVPLDRLLVVYSDRVSKSHLFNYNHLSVKNKCQVTI